MKRSKSSPAIQQKNWDRKSTATPLVSVSALCLPLPQPRIQSLLKVHNASWDLLCKTRLRIREVVLVNLGDEVGSTFLSKLDVKFSEGNWWQKAASIQLKNSETRSVLEKAIWTLPVQSLRHWRRHNDAYKPKWLSLFKIQSFYFLEEK